jgi:hypothetical protein
VDASVASPRRGSPPPDFFLLPRACYFVHVNEKHKGHTPHMSTHKESTPTKASLLDASCSRHRLSVHFKFKRLSARAVRVYKQPASAQEHKAASRGTVSH